MIRPSWFLKKALTGLAERYDGKGQCVAGVAVRGRGGIAP